MPVYRLTEINRATQVLKLSLNAGRMLMATENGPRIISIVEKMICIINTTYTQMRSIQSAGSFIMAVGIVLIVSFFAYRQVADARKSVYVLDANSVPLLARQTNLQ